MKRLLLILIFINTAGFCAAFDEMFADGQIAYDEGNYAEAIGCYESMLSNGVVNAEVHYNLANACFKSGDLPPAIWHYRTAWYSTPRDPDINANLKFALNAAGAVETTPPFVDRAASSLSAREWIMVAAAAYLVLSALLLLALLIRRARQSLLKLCLVPAAGLLIAVGGWWFWQSFRTQPEAVVVNTGVTALFGPVEGSTAHYKIPAGALVRQTAEDPKGWVEVEYDNKLGWVRKGDILTLSP